MLHPELKHSPEISSGFISAIGGIAVAETVSPILNTPLPEILGVITGLALLKVVYNFITRNTGNG